MAVINAAISDMKTKEKIEEFSTRAFKCLKKGFCPTRDLLSKSTDKWSIFCLLNLAYHDNLRFNQLKSKIRGISSRMLSQTLKRLESQHIVQREIYAEVPPRVEYSLSEFGHAYSKKILDLSIWVLDEYEKIENSDQRAENSEQRTVSRGSE